MYKLDKVQVTGGFRQINVRVSMSTVKSKGTTKEKSQLDSSRKKGFRCNMEMFCSRLLRTIAQVITRDFHEVELHHNLRGLETAIRLFKMEGFR